MARAALSEDEIRARLKERPDWEHGGDRIRRTFRFASFVEAFGWMASVALVAEKLDHHRRTGLQSRESSPPAFENVARFP